MKESISFFYEFLEFFECIKAEKVKAADLRKPSKLFIYNLKELYNFGKSLGYFNVIKTNITFSKKGSVLADFKDPKQILVNVLKEYVSFFKPNWRRLLGFGANKAKFFLPPSIKQLFEECGLFNFKDQKTFYWWLSFKKEFNAVSSNKKDEVGLIGEELTYEFERNRVGIYPEWRSLLDDSSGFDFISKKSKLSCESLYIDSKASRQKLSYAIFFISRNEWEICKLYKNSYSFYFWLLSTNPPFLHRFFYHDLVSFIPKDTSKGKWEISSFRYSELI